MIIKQIIEDIKQECENRENRLSTKQEEILKYYLDFHLKNLF